MRALVLGDLGAWRERYRRLAALRLDDGAGLPPADPRAERVGNALAWAASAFMALVGLWEILGPFGAGHYSASTAIAIGGENYWRYGALAPVPTYLNGPPALTDFYCHHPFGVFWTAAAFAAVFGHHAWVCRLPAVLISAALPRLIYGGGRALHGPLAGGTAALGYAVLPITLAYANFFALELPTMFGLALATYGLARFVQAERRRFAVLTVLGLAYAAACDWPGFFFAGLVLAALFLRGFVLARWLPPFRFDRFASLWAWGVVAVGGLALFHLAVLVRVEHVGELLRSGDFRSTGSSLPLSDVLAQRRYWIALAFTPLAIVIGKVAMLVLAARVLIWRRGLELLPLGVLATASVQYVVFKQAADIHFFWPQYFALYFAYAVGALVAGLDRSVAWATSQLPTRRQSLASWAVGVLGLGTVLAILPDGLTALVYARKTGGRFNEKGLIIHPDFDKAAALGAVAPTLPPDALVGLANSMKASYWMDWVLQRPVRYVGLPRLDSAGVTTFALDSRFDTRGALETLTREFSVRAIGPFLIADTRAPAAPVVGYGLFPRRLGTFERFFVATTHDVFDVVPDPYLTWELRAHLQQAPNPEPEGAPRGFEDLRRAHNVAVAKGDGPRAERLLAELLAGVDRRAARRYTGGVELLGVRLERGASTVLTLYFRTGEPLPTDVEFKVAGTVLASPRHSLVPRDTLRWDIGMPFALPTTLWHPGFVYSAVSELVPRPGGERYEGAFQGPQAPTLAGSGPHPPLLELD